MTSAVLAYLKYEHTGDSMARGMGSKNTASVTVHISLSSNAD